MSTNPPTTDPPRTDPRPTEIRARGRTDPWAATGTAGAGAAARAPRQFEPTSHERFRNLMDGENAYCD